MPVYRAKKPVKRVDSPIPLPKGNKRFVFRDPAFPTERGVLKTKAKIEQHGNKRKWTAHQGWGYFRTPLISIQSRMGLRPAWQIDRVMMRKLIGHTPEKPLYVVDWGCGEGTAAVDLQAIAQRYPAKVIGYSDVSYQAWDINRKKVDIIWTPKEDLPRFFRKRKIGIIYSHLGLMHLTPEELFEHLRDMSRCLERNAVLITDLGGEIRDAPAEHINAIRSAGFRMVARGKDGAAFIYHPRRASF